MRAETWSPMANVSQNAVYDRWGCVFGDVTGWYYSYMQGDIDNNATWRLYFRQQLANGSWSPPVQISTAKSEESRNGKYSDGNRYVVFQCKPGGTDEWMITENLGGTWSAPAFLTPNDGAADLCTDVNRVVDLDSADTFHILSQHYNGSQYNMRYYRKPRSGVVEDLGDVMPSGNYQINGAVRVTGSGANQAVHFLVAGGSTVPAWRCYYRRYQNGAFGSLVNLSNIVASQPSGAHAGNIIQLPSGKLIACIATNDAATSGDWEVWLLQSTDNGSSWNTPVNVSQTGNISRNPSCALDSQGDVVVAWEETTSPVQIMARRWRPATGLGQKFVLGPGFTVDVASHGTVTRAVWHNSSLTGDWEIVTSETDAVDTIAPSPVTQLAVTSSNSQNAISWKLPSDSDTAGARIRYRIDHYPVSARDGTLVADVGGSSGENGGYTHTNLTNGVTYHYAIFAYDDAGNYAASTNISATPALPMDFDHDGDVDLGDFGHIQTCLSGPDNVPNASCWDCALDADFDVDAVDLAIFLGCMRGPQIAADPNCVP